jgi:hypothetical protein
MTMAEGPDREYSKELMADVVARAGAEGRFHADAFFELVTDELVELGEIETADRAHHEARALRVDGYSGSPQADGELTLIVSDFVSDDPPPTMTRRDMDALLKRVTNFLQHALDAEWRRMINESSPGAQLASLIATSWEGVESIRILLITNRPLSDRVKTSVAENFEGRPVTHLIWDLTRLRELRQSGSAREVIAIDLVGEFGSGVRALKIATKGDLYDGYLAAVNGRVLANIFRRYGARLLEQNVRVFLQARGKINQGIRNTISHDPDRFFAYNNGITATASAVRTIEVRGGCEIVGIENLQIVNGGQTTSSLHAALRSIGDADNLDRIVVQMKLAVLRPDDIETMVPNISKYANSQNKVSDADFHANAPYHQEMKRHSERVLAPREGNAVQMTRWYYERARGQYADQKNKLTPAQWAAFQAQNPKSQVLTKTDIAKFDMVWRQFPHVVSQGAQKNFEVFMRSHILEEWAKDKSQFHEEYFKRLVAKAIIFRHVEELVSNASWYDGGYRANIVAYTIARIARKLEDLERVLDFDKVWTEQGVGRALAEVLSRVAQRVNAVLMAPPESKKNISEWAKLAECWGVIAKIDIDGLGRYAQISVEKSSHRQSERSAAADQRVLAGAEATIEVHNRGAVAWRDLEAWASGKKLLTPPEMTIVGYAASGMNLSRHQAPIALDAWDKVRKAGWGGAK